MKLCNCAVVKLCSCVIAKLCTCEVVPVYDIGYALDVHLAVLLSNLDTQRSCGQLHVLAAVPLQNEPPVKLWRASEPVCMFCSKVCGLLCT